MKPGRPSAESLEPVLDPQTLALLMQGACPPCTRAERRLAVQQLVALGFKHAVIAELLCIHIRTVGRYLAQAKSEDEGGSAKDPG